MWILLLQAYVPLSIEYNFATMQQQLYSFKIIVYKYANQFCL